MPQKLFLFSEVIFNTPPKRPFKTSVKITSRGYFYFLRLFFLPREVISKKLPQKILRESTRRLFVTGDVFTRYFFVALICLEKQCLGVFRGFSVALVLGKFYAYSPWKSLLNVGACAMTTKFLDHKICTFKILLSWRFPRKKQRFWPIFLSARVTPPPPLKNEMFIFIVVSPSLTKGARSRKWGNMWKTQMQNSED